MQFITLLLSVYLSSYITIQNSWAGKDKIIDENTMVAVAKDLSNLPANLKPYANAIGIINLAGGGICSGTHIGNGYVLTAGHCFHQEINEPNIKYAACSETSVTWGYRGSSVTTARGVAISKCQQVLFAEYTMTRDFAIFKVDFAAPATIPLANSGRVQSGTKITILGYPQGRPLEWSRYCTAGSAYSGDHFTHQCDTEPGNSGSSVIAISSTGKPLVIGIHVAGGNTMQNFNVATYLSDAKKSLQANGINLDAVSPRLLAFY